MRPTTSLMCVLLLLGALGACSRGGGDERGSDALTAPTFAPEAGAATNPTEGTTGDSPDSTSPADGGTAPTAPGGVASPATTVPPGGTAPRSVTIDDPVGDAVGGVEPDPPAWSDLAGATLRRTGDAFALSVRLGGGRAPETAESDATMNIASFYDIDGDGVVDYEIWANLGPGGWGPTWYDDIEGDAAAGEDSSVTIEVEGDVVRFLFPDVLLASAPTFRFSVASEYGDLATIGSAFARRDDAPDGDRAVSFPG